MTAQTPARTGVVLGSLLVLYTLASFVHFAHNAEYLAEYPNLPTWLTRVGIYVTWIAIASLGLVGYVLLRCGRGRFGLALLAVYATLGLDGLLHYTRAPFSAHTTAMNFTILFEVVAATLTLIAVVALAAKEITGNTRTSCGGTLRCSWTRPWSGG